MYNVILIRYGEIHLKGYNRPFFERLLQKNMQSSLSGLNCRVTKGDGRYYAEGLCDNDFNTAVNRLQKVFGVHSISPAVECAKDWEIICKNTLSLLKAEAGKRGGNFTFKVMAKRSDKTFVMDSMTICRELGHVCLEDGPGGISVDVKKPDVYISVEIREKAYIYCETIECAKGMPVGCNGKAMLLLSGGIDSPVAGYMMAKRGLSLQCVHFFSFPYTGEPAKRKVRELASLLSGYCGGIELYMVPFTEIQTQIYEKCREKNLTIIMRRYMMKIAERLAQNGSCGALVTGESVGQVASQTLDSLVCTDNAVDMPVFRPLIGFDKLEIIELSKKIGTFETSILPYEDCCTVFVPKHPSTRPKLEDIIRDERILDEEKLLQEAIEAVEQYTVNANG